MSRTKFEDFANEIFLDIFDYLRPIDILFSFCQLNHRFEILLTQRSMHVDLTTNVSFDDFHMLCSKYLSHYSTCIHSIRLSNVETCGSINLFFNLFPQLYSQFSNLNRMIFIEPTEFEFKRILELKYLVNLQIKFKSFYEKEISFGLIFDLPNLQFCTVFYPELYLINKFRPNPILQRLVLNSFYINDIHFLFQLYPLLQHLTIHQLRVNFQGYLPPFQQMITSLVTLKFNCHYTIRFDYLVYLLSFFPKLKHLTIVAIGLDYFHSEKWIQTLTNLEYLTKLILDLKGISPTFDDELSLAFLTGFWRQWQFAVDYSPDNHKFHLYTVPYHRSSFISTIHCLSVTDASQNAFVSTTDLYLKVNTPIATDQMTTQRTYPNVRALQIYQNALVPMNYSNLFSQLNSMIQLHTLVHFELFISMPPSTFLALVQLAPCLRTFKTDYEILMVNEVFRILLFSFDVCFILDNNKSF